MPDPVEMLVRAAEEFTAPDERRAFLDWACRDQPALRERVGNLLALQSETERFFDFNPFAGAVSPDAPPEVAPDDTEVEGLRIGPYRLLRRLGTGGQGVVYLAEQERPVRRQVALKLIRPGLDHAAIARRFEMEREALAMMDHPGIARVLDAGTTAAGRSYFVMEWVAGRPITRFCDEQKIPVRRRLELFIHVCHAVQHAHQKGVIHRDLKPSNILIATHDEIHLPKVIDFGIAKATAPGDAEPASESEAALGTPDYMSPEQAVPAGNVDTRADIFSLGAVLNELLAGSGPFEPQAGGGKTTRQVRQFIQDRRPRVPSQILRGLPPEDLQAVADRRSCRPRQLVAMLEGDLDAIILKCLEQDPNGRYQTANALAADLSRHLDGLPVEARPDKPGYRLGKLVRRNRVVFSFATIVFLLLLAGFGTTTRLYLQENQARREQSRLRKESEEARSVETKLRAQAEAREICAQAAVKLSYGQIEQADQLLATIPTDRVPSSMEAAEAYRKVGEWHRKAGRIQQAAERFTALATAISTVDRSDLYKISTDILPAAVTTCEAGDWPRYEQVRRVALERFGATRNLVVAEQIIKACTLRPADPATMEKISPLVGFLYGSIGPEARNVPNVEVSAWHCYSLAMWNHRLRDPAQTIRWCQLSLQRSMASEPRVVCVSLLLAMARHRTGETEEARKLLADAAKPIRTLMESSSGKWADNIVWVDWMNAHILLKEAEESLRR